MAHSAVQQVQEHPPEAETFFEFDLPRAQLIKRGQEYFAAVQQWLRENNAQLDGRQAIARFTKAYDEALVAAHDYVAHVYESEEGRPAPAIAIAALGGYGRRELFLQSDVDLLVLMEPGADEVFVKSLLHLLIDFRLNLGYATRTVADCAARLGVDLDSTTAMTEMRLLSGNKTLFTQCQAQVKSAVMGKWRKWFLSGLLQEWGKRQEKYESTVYLLEPNIKECPGGLRNVHTVGWFLFALSGAADLRNLKERAHFDDDEIRHFREALGFIEKVRNQLHVVSGSKTDQLLFAFQPAIAAALGFEDQEHRSAAEVFMGKYYRQARTIARESERAIRLMSMENRSLFSGLKGSLRRIKIDKHLVAQDDKLFVNPREPRHLEQDSSRILPLFEKAARLGMRLSDRTLDALTRISRGLGEEFSGAAENHKIFLNILRAPSNVAQTISDMHASQILDKLIPEFAPLTCMVRLDHYHHYTVDEHTLKALEMAEKLRRENPRARTFEGRVAAQIKQWDVLLFALLMHDIGKGHGRGHALRGGQIAQRVGDRLEMSEADVELARFLVLSHLKISHTAQRRDLSDRNVARQLAAEIGSLERLRLLYVHSVCDLMAVSPEAYNDWRAKLMAEAYVRTAEELGEKVPQRDQPEPNLVRLREHVSRAIEQQQNEAAARDGKKMESFGKAQREELNEEIEDFLRHAGDRYAQDVPPETMAYQLTMRRGVSEKQPLDWIVLPDKGSGMNEIAVCALDHPGLFQSICGALVAKGINIWSAQIYSATDGFALNRFQVTDIENKPLAPDLRLERLRHDLNLVLRGEMEIEQLIEKHRGRAKKKTRARLPNPPRVLFDNETSVEYTIIEVRANDRPGLLYLITHALSECQLDIKRAIITTDAYTFDVFYVTDLDYNKIHDEPARKKIEEKILEAVEEGI